MSVSRDQQSKQLDENVIETPNERRKFLEKFGKLAVVTPFAVTALMSPSTSAAPSSGCHRQKGCKNN